MTGSKQSIIYIFFAMVLTFISLLPASVQAQFQISEVENRTYSSFPEEISGENLKAMPRYVASCPYASKHRMMIKGQAFVYTGTEANRGNLLFAGGVSYQCSNCRLVVAAQKNASVTGMLGYYYICQWPPLTGVVQTFYTGGNYAYNSGNLKQDSFWRGFDWYWA